MHTFTQFVLSDYLCFLTINFDFKTKLDMLVCAFNPTTGSRWISFEFKAIVSSRTARAT